MKTLLLIFALVISTSFYAQEETATFDEKLANELGADNYGMKRYVMAFLKKGPNRTKDSIKATNLQMAHMSNIKRLAEEGKLAIAGPFLDNGELRGIYIFNVETVDEAKKLTETDPAIQAGSLVMELHPWYGSAALGLVAKYHDKISKVKM
ncbi:YciI family protein [Aureibaculum conchae]|uniref:YciI family protein n=1 Tax=Aureibaculum sp. 2308TA14-22 TaxID=3108392 RepID=UPI003398E4BF